MQILLKAGAGMSSQEKVESTTTTPSSLTHFRISSTCQQRIRLMTAHRDSPDALQFELLLIQAHRFGSAEVCRTLRQGIDLDFQCEVLPLAGPRSSTSCYRAVTPR
jgi:hypothetical protein